MLRISATFAAVAVISLLGATAEAQQLPKSGKYTGKYASHLAGGGQTYELEKGHVFFLGASHGIFFNDVADGFLDKTEVTCAIANDLVDGASTALNGHCIITDKDGDIIFSTFDTRDVDKSQPKYDCGTHIITGGTGKYSGITGREPFNCKPLASLAGSGDMSAMDIEHNTSWEIKPERTAEE